MCIDGSVSRALAFDKWLDAAEEGADTEVRMFVLEVLPLFVTCLRSIAPFNECSTLREKFCSVTRSINQSFGEILIRS